MVAINSLRNVSLALALAAFPVTSAVAQQGTPSGSESRMSGNNATAQSHTPGADDMSKPNPAGAQSWTEPQILTATVHQAWMLSGQNETNFFEIVRQLAEISARNRSLELPDDPAAGKRAGEYVREQARADHDQLLYAIVDKAVQMTAKKAPETASAPAR